MSVATFANMYVVLTTLYPPEDPATNPVVDWLGIGGALRSEPWVVAMALMHTAVFVWALVQLRRSAHDRLTDELAEGRREPDRVPAARVPMTGPGASAVAAPTRDVGRPDRRRAPPSPAPGRRYRLPTWTERRSAAELGWTGWIRERLTDPPIRADRSRPLVGECGGRLDRLDVWFMVVLVVAALGVRTFRLAEPYQMQFDEVYHARTADRVPAGLALRRVARHLRVDPSAPRQVRDGRRPRALGRGRGQRHERPRGPGPRRRHRAATRGHPVRAGRRRTASTSPRATEIRVLRPALRRDLVARHPGARRRSALAVDPADRLLLVGSDDGSVATLDLDSSVWLGGRCRPRRRAAADARPPDRAPARQRGRRHDPGRIRRRADRGRRATGESAASTTLPGIADLAQAGTGASLVATPSAMGDPDAAGGDPGRSPRRRRRRRTSRSSPSRGPDARSSSARRALARPGPRSTPPSPTAAWPASRSSTCPASPSRPRPASCSWIRRRPACRATSSLPAGRTAWPRHRHRRSEAVRDDRPDAEPAYEVDRRSVATSGRWPRWQRPPSRCPGSGRGWPTTTAPRWSTSWARRRARDGGARLDGVRRRAARRPRSSSATRRCRPECCRRRGPWTSRPQYPTDDRAAAARLRRGRDDGVDRRSARTPSPGGCPASSPASLMAPVPVRPGPDPVPPPVRGGHPGRPVSSSTGCSSPSRGSA